MRGRSESAHLIIAYNSYPHAGVSIAEIAAREGESEPHAAKPRKEMLLNPLKTNNPDFAPQ
jgi:hypothetical protein